MNIKAIFFDIDGTLLDSRTHKINDSTIEAFKLLKKKDIKLFIASGRSYNMLHDSKIPLEYFDGYICNNGASIYDKDFNLLKATYIDRKKIFSLLELANKENITLTFETIDDVFNVNEPNQYLMEAYDYFKCDHIPIKEYTNQNILMAVAYNDMSYDWNKFANMCDLNALPGASTHCDLANKGVSKHTGIVSMLDLHNIYSDEYMCFGDQMNDYDMLKNCSHPVIVLDDKSSKYLKDNFKNHALMQSEDGIYKYLKSINII